MRQSILVFLIFQSFLLSGQRETYLGVGFGLITATSYPSYFPARIISQHFIDGGLYDAYLRQEISDHLSIKAGYSWRNYDYEFFIFDEKYVYPPIGFWAHQIPLSADIYVDVFKDLMDGYASFGYLFCVQQYTFDNTRNVNDCREDLIELQYEFLPGSKHSSLFTSAVGSRIKLSKNLISDIELGY